MFAICARSARAAKVVLEPLTPAERLRHEEAIQRIRQRLFRRYEPTHYFIVPNSERLLAG